MERQDKPLYQQLKEILKEKIEKGEYKEGDKIPSIIQLSKIYKVSTITVRQAIRELLNEGYVETNTARGTYVSGKWKEIKISQEKIVGVIFTEFTTNPFYSEIFEGIEKVLTSCGYHIIVNSSQNNPEKEARILRELMERKVNGIIISPTTVNRNLYADNTLKEVIENGIPVVFVDRKLENFDCDYITTNNFEGGYMAAKYLIEKGHKRIGIILGIGANTVQERFDGYKRALIENGIEFDPLLVKKSYVEMKYAESGYQATIELLSIKNPPTAIFACNDGIAMGVYKACGELGMKIPDDLSVIGYDNLSISEYFLPPLTTVHQPKVEMGVEAAKVLLSRIQGDKTEKKEIILKCKLIERGSCKSGEKEVVKYEGKSKK